MTAREDHWEAIYSTTGVTTLSWYEREPTCSLQFIERTGTPPSAAVVDIGAGTSTLVDRLLDYGFTKVSVLDISERALTEVRRRLGERAARVTFIQHDVLTWQPDRRYDIWHDRAVFHFLTDSADQGSYVQLAGDTVSTRGWLLLATFALDGPTRCSGLPVSRYSAEEIGKTFSPAFGLVESQRELHLPPKGVAQPFTWVRLRHT
jgi:SAM-dependent methyltransferase